MSNQTIKAAQKANEEHLIRVITKHGYWYPNLFGVTSVPMFNAKDRLLAADKIRFDNSAGGGCGGYVLTQPRSK